MIQYIVTERAHLMCPNMHFGIKARIAASYDKEKVQTALEALTSAPVSYTHLTLPTTYTV